MTTIVDTALYKLLETGTREELVDFISSYFLENDGSIRWFEVPTKMEPLTVNKFKCDECGVIAIDRIGNMSAPFKGIHNKTIDAREMGKVEVTKIPTSILCNGTFYPYHENLEFED